MLKGCYLHISIILNNIYIKNKGDLTQSLVEKQNHKVKIDKFLVFEAENIL